MEDYKLRDLRASHTLVLFIIRVKRELKRVYRNGCRYNERVGCLFGKENKKRI